MDEFRWEDGFLDPVAALGEGEIEAACEAAFRNAVELLDEADILRRHGRCARAYFLAHIACEELGKLPILVTAAVAQKLGSFVDWKRIDRVLRSHEGKFKQALFMDSVVGQKTIQEGAEHYEDDVRRLRTYTDMKNASLYSFRSQGSFHAANEMPFCRLFDSFRGLARGRLTAFESMYLRPMRDAGGLSQLLTGRVFDRVSEVMARLTGAEGRAAFDEYQRTGDESGIRALFNRLLGTPEEASGGSG